jgi:hypothetical protein
MTEDEKRLLQEEFTKAGSVPALLEAMASEETKEFQDLKDQVERGPHHPTGDELYEYVLGWLDRKESLLIMDHLVLCGRCLREVIKIRRLEEELTEDALARADKVPLLDRLKGLLSKLSFPVSIYEPAFGAVRGADQAPEEREYKSGTDLVLSVEAPADGYVTIFHGCEETGEVELVFPWKRKNNPKVSGGQRVEPIRGETEGPPGRHFFTLIWTRERPPDPRKFDLHNEEERKEAEKEFLDDLCKLNEEDWGTATLYYEVTDR